MKKFEEIISKYKMKTTTRYGEKALKLCKKATEKDLEFLLENKQDIIKYLLEKEKEEYEKIKAEEKATEEATITFLSTGWESHEIIIDTRKCITTQIEKYADIYSNDCNVASLTKDLNKKIGKMEEVKLEEIKVAEEAKEEQVKAFELAKKTGEKQVIRRWAQDCESNIDCSVDIVTKWAMPNGMITKTKIHSY